MFQPIMGAVGEHQHDHHRLVLFIVVATGLAVVAILAAG
jgi:hypothetical protein